MNKRLLSIKLMKLTFILITFIIQNMFTSRSAKVITKFTYTVIKNEIAFTESFNKALKSKLAQRKQNEFLRLEINAGEGCEGFVYKFKFDSNLNESDYVKIDESKRVNFAVGKEDVALMEGSTLDFVKEMMRQTFLVKENPNAEVSCGCKTSFSPKDFVI